MLIYSYMDIPGISREQVLYAPVPRRRCVHTDLRGTDTQYPVDVVRIHQPHDLCALKDRLPSA